MAFRLAREASYWWPVKFRTPSEKPGEFVDASFEVEYRYLSVAEDEALRKDAAENKLDDRQVVPRIVKGFRGVEDESGAQVQSTPEELAALTNVPGVAGAIVDGYYGSRAEAAAKN